MKLAVVGLGKLGSCLAGVLAHTGHDVVGIDTDAAACQRVLAKVSPESGFADLDLATLTTTTSSEALRDAAMSFLIVPTPSLPDGSFSDEYLQSALREVGRWATPDHICVIVSTVSPGTIRRLVATYQPSFTIVYSPLFVALGSVIYDLQTADVRLVGAEEPDARTKVAAVLQTIDGGRAKIFQLSWEEVEIAKLSVNAYVVMKIAFANMIAAACATSDHTNARSVMSAVGYDKRIGQAYLRPGGPPAGPCFPRDSVALVEYLDRAGVSAAIPRAVIHFNQTQVCTICQHFETYNTVAILGLSYKPGTPVTDESLGVKVGEMLVAAGKRVIAHDPMAKAPTAFTQVSDPASAIAQADAVLIATAWPEYAMIDTAGKPTLNVWK